MDGQTSRTFEPECLQLGVVLRCELVVFEEAVQLLKVAPVEGDHCLRLQHGLVQLQLITLGQGPQEASQSLDLATLLQYLAHARHLLLGEPETGQSLSTRRPVLCRCQHVCGAADDVQAMCTIGSGGGTVGGQLWGRGSRSVRVIVVEGNRSRRRR